MQQSTSLEKKNWQRPLSPEAISRFFKACPLCERIPPQAMSTLVAQAKTRHLTKGNIVFRMGDPSNWVYFIYAGYVIELVSYGGSMDIMVKTRNPGDYIGEMGMLVDESYPNTAVAMENLTVLALPREVFLSSVWGNSTMAQYIVRQLIDRLTNSARKMINAMYLDAPGRLAFTLVTLSGDMSEHCGSISITQSDLAATSGIARQTVAKILGDWRRAGWISTLRGKIAVHSSAALLDIIVDSELRAN